MKWGANRSWKGACVGAGLAGLLFGLVESVGVLWGSKTLISDPVSLLLFAVLTAMLLSFSWV